MSLPLRLLGAAATLFAVLAGAASLDAQGRFTVLARDGVPSVPELRIMTIHDAAQNACYLLFVVDTAIPPGPGANLQPPDIQQAAAARDRRLSELNNAYLQTFGSLYPGTPANILPFQFEAQKIESEFSRVVRENELAWLQDQLQRMSSAPKTAVSGPVPCEMPASPPPRPTR